MTRVAMTRPALLAACALALPLMVLVPSGADAGTYQKAKVVRVLDGDTIDVDRNHDGRIDARVRLIGIDAPEHGLCGFRASTNALKSLVKHKNIELRSDKGRTGIMNRLERRVIVPIAGGQKVDASTWMLERGWGVWMPRDGEITQSLQQHQAADRAAAAGLGWFNGDRCGIGPFSEQSLTMQVQYISDAAHWMGATALRNQEFIRIRNDGPEPVSIDGWTLRVGNDRSRRVPGGGAIPPGQAVDIHVGFGTNSATDRFLGSSVPMLVNASIDGGKHLGSGSYLIDPNNDIRAHMTWPCTYQCVDPMGGALVFSNLSIDPDGNEGYALNTEWVEITNQGTVPVQTGSLVLEAWPYIYEFPPDHWLAPGETMRVSSGSGDDTRLSRHLKARVPPLDNFNGRVLLRTYDAITVDCVDWGKTRCPAGS